MPAWIIQPTDPVLVTGANGFIGAKVIETLLGYGFTNVRCLVRSSGRLDRLKRWSQGANIEIVRGDVTSQEDCDNAVRGVRVLYHLAAGFDKSFAGAYAASAIGTRNLLDAVIAQRSFSRFVNVSSFAVYSNLRLPHGATLDESCPLEDSPQERYDAYGFGKLEQEKIVREYGERYGIRYVILRPGMVFGPGKTELSGRVGIDTFGVFINVGGRNLLPLTYVDNCAEAIVLAGLVPGAEGATLNVVDDELMTSGQFLRAYRKRRRLPYVRIPYRLAYWLCHGWEWYAKRSLYQLPPAFNRRRCAADWKRHRFPNGKIRETLMWSPKIGVNEALDRFLGQFPDPQ